MEQVRGTFSAHMLSCSADPQAPLSSVDPGTMADICWLNHLWATAREWGDDSDSWSSQQQSIAAAHTQLDALFGWAPTWEAYLTAYVNMPQGKLAALLLPPSTLASGSPSWTATTLPPCLARMGGICACRPPVPHVGYCVTVRTLRPYLIDKPIKRG